jgi:kumamolisin
MAFFAASGDAGAYECQDSKLAVDSPASDPNVTGVGGTTLQMQDAQYGSESAWSNPQDNLHGPKGAGTGGGISNTYKQPFWQKGPGVQNRYSNGNREVPDVAANADPATGYAVYCTVRNAGCPAAGWVRMGGTSAATPLWAASVALMNQYLAREGKPALGMINPALYGLFNAPQAFPAYHSVTTGDNLFYPATPGYNMATGLGTPDVYNIVRDFNMR